jgi:CBS domain-containing protein
MHVKDFMTSDPACCAPDTSLSEVARMMVEYDCGEIPVVESEDNKKPIGVVTDRDIVTRTIGAGLNPMDLCAEDCMSMPVVTVMPDTTFEECQRVMEEKQIRRVPVVDKNGVVCGIVALADITKYASKKEAGKVLQEVSVEIGAASNVS